MRQVGLAQTALALLIAVLGAAAVAQEATPGLYDRPVLVLEPGMHTASIRDADVDASGRLAVTGSYDQTIRLWSVADGRLIRTIRVPQGPGDVGKIYAVAMSPDGQVVAAGGWTRWTAADPQQQIYFFDSGSGAIMARIAGLPDGIEHLAFSPDGRYLAATLWGSSGLRIYDREADWAERARDTDYGDSSYGAAFAPDGRLATTSDDGKLRLHDQDFALAKIVETENDGPFGLAFSPGGERLAVGFIDAIGVALFDGHNLDPLPSPDTSGIDNGSLGTIAWSADGETLYAAGRHNVDGVVPVVAWDMGGMGHRSTLPVGLDTVMSLRPLPAGRLLIAAQDPLLGVLDSGGQPAWTNGPAQANFKGQRYGLALSADGTIVEFGYRMWGESRARFDVAKLLLTVDPTEDDRLAPPVQDGLPIENWINNRSPLLGGEPLPLKRYEMSRSLAIHPDGERFALGTEWSLHAFDAEGSELWHRGAPGAARAVNISGDGRLVVVAYGDGTIRWHRMDDGAELLAFFPLADRKNGRVPSDGVARRSSIFSR